MPSRDSTGPGDWTGPARDTALLGSTKPSASPSSTSCRRACPSGRPRQRTTSPSIRRGTTSRIPVRQGRMVGERRPRLVRCGVRHTASTASLRRGALLRVRRAAVRPTNSRRGRVREAVISRPDHHLRRRLPSRYRSSPSPSEGSSQSRVASDPSSLAPADPRAAPGDWSFPPVSPTLAPCASSRSRDLAGSVIGKALDEPQKLLKARRCRRH